jgi:sortase A
LTAVAVVCLTVWTAVKVNAYAVSTHDEAVLSRLVAERRTDGALPPSDTWPWRHGVPADGALLGRIDIPRVGVSSVILQGAGERWLEQGAGHVSSTPLPGADGNVAIAGHRDSVFRGLQEIRLGDAIELTTPAVTRLYRVDAIRIVSPTDTAVLDQTSTPSLTLITCFPFHYIGPAPHRFVVEARAVRDGGQFVVVPPRPTATARLGTPAGPALALQRTGGRRPRVPLRTAWHRGHLPEPEALPHIPAVTTPPPHKVSWLRRLLHLGPRRAARR